MNARNPLALASLGLLACGGLAGSEALGVEAVLPTAQASPVQVSGLKLEPASYAPLVEALSPTVVNVEVKGTAAGPEAMVPDELRRFFGFESPGQRPTQGQGSGFVISADGYVLTNYHVVQGADEIAVTFADETRLDATLVGSDGRIDVALLQIEGASGLPYVALGSSASTRVGDRVVAMGNPFGLGHTVTTGIVSGKGRALGAGPYDDFLQIDAAINPGNSGGPLFNLEGEVVGINTAIIAQANNIGFTIPIDMVQEVLEDLKTRGSVARGWLGVGIQEVTPELASGLGLEVAEGVLLNEVHPGGPADASGLEGGDVVLRVAGEAVGDPDALIRAVGSYRAGETVDLVVARSGRERRVQVALGERPSEDALRTGRWDAPQSGGVSGPGFTLEEGPEGLVVRGLDPESVAAEVLQEGDVLVEVDRQRVRSSADAARRLAKGGRHVLLVKRDGRQHFVILPTE